MLKPFHGRSNPALKNAQAAGPMAEFIWVADRVKRANGYETRIKKERGLKWQKENPTTTWTCY
jgi:hypothetical protein